MKSATVPSFWERYGKLEREIRARAKKAYRLWAEDPFHPSLRFKCINRDENIWSVRITLVTALWVSWTKIPSHGSGLAVMTSINDSSVKPEWP